MAERDGLGSGWDRLEHQERSREPLQDSQYEGERTEKVFPSFGGQRPLARKYGGSLADGTTKSRAFQQGRPYGRTTESPQEGRKGCGMDSA